MEKKQNNKKYLILGLILVAIIAVFAVIYFATKPSTQKGSKSIQLTIEKGENDIHTITLHTDTEYLGEALKEADLIKGEDGPYGLYITEVDGTVADENTQQWWCITKDNEQVNTSADLTPIADGEKYELTLKTGW